MKYTVGGDYGGRFWKIPQTNEMKSYHHHDDEKCVARNDRPLHQYYRHPSPIKPSKYPLSVVYNDNVGWLYQNRPRSELITLQPRVDIGWIGTTLRGGIQLLENKIYTQHPPRLDWNYAKRDCDRAVRLSLSMNGYILSKKFHPSRFGEEGRRPKKRNQFSIFRSHNSVTFYSSSLSSLSSLSLSSLSRHLSP